MTTNDSDRSRAATLFTGIMTLAAGGAGLLVAGLVLGLDYLLHGEPNERQHVAEQRSKNRQRRYQDALDWLEADRADRERARKARREWFTADPATRGDAPPSGETFGRALGRTWNWLLVGGTRFRRGWQKGRADARQRREAGQGDWWKRPADAARPVPAREPEPATAGTPRPVGDEPAADVVDVEIVPDRPGTPRDVVPVGADTPARGAGVNGYAAQLDELQREVDQTRAVADDDPSPSRSRLS